MKEPIHNSFAVKFGFYNWHFFLREGGTPVAKHVGEAHLMFVLIKNLHLVSIINGVREY
jgi:hypothetical protein